MEQDGSLHHILISFLDDGETTQTQLEAGTNSIATTGGVLNLITGQSKVLLESIQHSLKLKAYNLK